jgi:hypothetical protein
MKITYRPEIDYQSIEFKDKTESRSYLKDGKIKGTKPNGKDYRFERSDILKLVS